MNYLRHAWDDTNSAVLFIYGGYPILEVVDVSVLIRNYRESTIIWDLE